MITYEMLTGVNPFAGPTGLDYAAVLMGRFPPLTMFLQGSPTRWQEFFERALALDPGRRPKLARAFFGELEQVLV
ncbi:MAG: hypothetical protein LAO07_00280 [Acidobacteriia bacterium]|nr:hypothetical protein [Terriglobia bacterium]